MLGLRSCFISALFVSNLFFLLLVSDDLWKLLQRAPCKVISDAFQ